MLFIIEFLAIFYNAANDHNNFGYDMSNSKPRSKMTPAVSVITMPTWRSLPSKIPDMSIVVEKLRINYVSHYLKYFNYTALQKL